MKQFELIVVFVIALSSFSSGSSIFNVQSDRFMNTVEKNFIGLDLAPLKFYSDNSGEQCTNIFKLVDTLVLTAPGYIRITSPSNQDHEQKMDADFYRNFFKFIKDVNSNIILSYEDYDSDFEFDVSNKIIMADEIGFKQIFLEINMANINSTCDEFVEELKIMKNLIKPEDPTIIRDIVVKIVVSNIQHCLVGNSEKEQKYFLFKIAENSDAILFSELDLESIKGIKDENIPNTLRLWGTEAWTLMKHDKNNPEKRLTQTVLKIGDATKSGFTRVFEDIEDASNRKSASEVSGIEFFLTIYKLSAGSEIIDVTSTTSNPTEMDVKVYAQCSEESNSLFIYAINSGNETRNVTIGLDSMNDENKFTEYIITEKNGILNINDQAYDSKNVEIMLRDVESTSSFLAVLPPNSVGLWPAVPVNSHICKKIDFNETEHGVLEEKTSDENERVKREIDEESNTIAIVANENITDINEQPQLLILFINSVDNTTVDMTKTFENIEEQYIDEMKNTVTVLRHLVQFLQSFYVDFEEENNFDKLTEVTPDDSAATLENNSVNQPFENKVDDNTSTSETEENKKRIPRQVTDEMFETYGESESQMEERMSTFGKSIRPPPHHLALLHRQKLDHALKNAKQSMQNLKHQAKFGLKPPFSGLKPGFQDLALKDKLLKQKLKAESLRQKIKLDFPNTPFHPRGKFGLLVKRDTNSISNTLNSVEDDFPKACESKTAEIFKAPNLKVCSNQPLNLGKADGPFKGFKRFKYAAVWDQNSDETSQEDQKITTIRNDIKKRSAVDNIENEEFDLVSESSNNDWSWENIKCKLGFCEDKNQLQEVVDNFTKVYNNVKNKATELWKVLNE